MANKPGEANFFPDVPEFPSMGVFQPIYGKFDLTTYIQGASDYEIMAFLVGKYNACLEAYGNITKLSTDTITACKQLQDWINSWFTNLDVQEEINKKLDKMVADGSFETLMHKAFDAQVNQQTTSAVTAWLVANVTPTGSAVVVDKSLSIEGAAADAKIVGNTCYRTLDTTSELDTVKLGTYQIDTSVIAGLAGLFGLTETQANNYYWVISCTSPASANPYNTAYADYEQTLSGYHLNHTGEILMYHRYSESSAANGRQWSPWSEIDDRFVYTAKSDANDIDTVKLGTYKIDTSVIAGLAGLFGLTETQANNYYWVISCTSPASDNPYSSVYADYEQTLSGYHRFQTGEILRYHRYSETVAAIGRQWSPWSETDDRFFYTAKSGVNNIDIVKLGTYQIDTSVISQIATSLGLTESQVNNYYWVISCTSPASANPYNDKNADYEQTLSGYHLNHTGEILRYHRYSESLASTGRQWSPWSENATAAMKILAIGDSFTYNPNNITNYPEYLNKYPQFSVTNAGVSGATAGTWFDSHSNDITANYDMFIIAFGLNSDANGMGTIDSMDTTTFYGGFNAILQKIFTVNPTARIMLWCMDAWYLESKSNAVKEIADKYGCEYHSMKAEKNIPVRIEGKFGGVCDNLDTTYVNARTKAFAISDDNHHPNSKGNKYLADYLATIL